MERPSLNFVLHGILTPYAISGLGNPSYVSKSDGRCHPFDRLCTVGTGFSKLQRNTGDFFPTDRLSIQRATDEPPGT